MNYRCHNPKCADFRFYGERGVKVCERWRESFERYAEDVGEPPFAGAHLSRVDPCGDYEPGNVQWVTNEDNLKNSSSTRHVRTHDGVRTLAEASRDVGKAPSNVYLRVRKGMPPSKALLIGKRVHDQTASRYPMAPELLLRTISEIAREADVPHWALRTRLRRGMTIAAAICDIRYRRDESLAARARRNGVPYIVAYLRVRRGWSIDHAVSTPSRRKQCASPSQ